MVTTFDTCPVDILHLILDEACTDAGSTSQALSLTSRHLSLVARPYRHQNIALCGITQVERAIQYFSSLPPECRRVHHLFIADDPEERLPRMDESTSLAPGEPRDDDPGSARRGETGVFHGELFQGAVDQLLVLLAPRLRTLACVTRHSWQKFILSNMGEVHFPHLNGLVLSQTTRVPFPQDDSSLRLNMPNLCRLHLAYSGVGYAFFRVKTVVTFFVTRCPRLEHLRLSDVNFGSAEPGMLVCLAENVLSPREEDGLIGGCEESTMTNLKRIVVQLEERVKMRAYGEDLATLRAFQDAKREGTSGGFFVANPRLKRTCKEWEEEWLKVARGCYEAWEVPARDG